MTQDTIQSRSVGTSLSSLRQTKAIALVVSLVTFLVLAISFGWRWASYQQLIAGLAFYFAYMWHRRASQRLSETEAATSRS